MERKYTETDKELMLKLLEMQELTAPISLSIHERGEVLQGGTTEVIRNTVDDEVRERTCQKHRNCPVGIRVPIRRAV